MDVVFTLMTLSQNRNSLNTTTGNEHLWKDMTTTLSPESQQILPDATVEEFVPNYAPMVRGG